MFSLVLNKTKNLFTSSGVMGGSKHNHIFPRPSDVEEMDDLDEDTILKRKQDLKDSVYDCICSIRDPEKPASLEDLQVVYEDGVTVNSIRANGSGVVHVEFNPTVPHCSLATLIGLCIRIKLQRNLIQNVKVDITIKKGAHDTEEEINKQINDKERVAAAMENPNLREMVEKCIKEDEN